MERYCLLTCLNTLSLLRLEILNSFMFKEANKLPELRSGHKVIYLFYSYWVPVNQILRIWLWSLCSGNMCIGNMCLSFSFLKHYVQYELIMKNNFKQKLCLKGQFCQFLFQQILCNINFTKILSLRKYVRHQRSTLNRFINQDSFYIPNASFSLKSLVIIQENCIFEFNMS